jgi:hypothetical protein
MFARISASRGDHPICAFAGGSLSTTLLSCCAGALLPMLDTRAVLPLRGTCKEAHAAAATAAAQVAAGSCFAAAAPMAACMALVGGNTASMKRPKLVPTT